MNENDWERSPECQRSFRSFIDRLWKEDKILDKSERWNTSKEFRDARAAYRKRIQGS